MIFCLHKPFAQTALLRKAEREIAVTIENASGCFTEKPKCEN